jgi:hypothetical protein
MIVSHEHRFIFLKTRKTAGTSIEMALARIAGDDAIVTPVQPPEEGHRPQNHLGRRRDALVWARANPQGVARSMGDLVRWRRNGWDADWTRNYYNHMPAWLVRAKVGEKAWSTYFKFCFERNPWDKALSLYWWLTRDAEGDEGRPSFSDWLHANPDISDWSIYTLGGRLAVDAVGRYERLDEDLGLFLERVGVSRDGLEVPRAKSGVRRSDVLYDCETAELVRERCRREIEAFGFECPVGLLVS